MQDPSSQDLATPNLAPPNQYDAAAESQRELIDNRGTIPAYSFENKDWLAGADGQLNAIKGVEGSWSLPKIPNEVKLDLLMLGAIPDREHMQDFLWGVHSDMNQAVAPKQYTLGASTPQPPSLQQLTTPPDQQVQEATAPGPVQFHPPGSIFLPADDMANKLRRVFNGVAGLKAPEIIQKSATQDLKVRAISEGLLPANTPIDGSWDPQLHYIANDLAYKDFQNQILGARPGAVRTSSALELLYKWTDPAHLASSAVALGFLPNVEAIHNNIKDFSDSHNPLDLLKAVANVALPVVNDVLLFTGVSEVVAFGRAAQLGEEGIRALDAANEIGQSTSILGRAFRTADAASEVSRFQRPGWIAERLARADGPVSAIGDAMSAWRKQSAVMIAKKATQQTMKLGLAGQLESTLFPGLSGVGITGAGNQGQRIDQFDEARMSNPLTAGVSMALELPLAPPSIFKPGRFTQPVKDLTSWARKATTAVADDTALTNVLHEVFRANLQWRDPQTLAQYDAAVRNSSPGEALVAFLGNGDKQKAGEIMTHLATSAGLNQQAERAAAALGLNQLTDGNRWDEAVHLYRNKWINQLRPIATPDFENVDDVIQFAHTRAKTEWEALVNPEARDGLKGTVKARDQVFQDVRNGLLSEDPTERQTAIDAASAAIEHHNSTIRQQTSDFLLGGLDHDYFGNYVTNVWDRVSPDQWDQFIGANRRIEELYALGDVNFIDARQPGEWDWVPSSIADKMPGVIDPKDLRNLKGLDAFGGTVDPLKGHFTVMRQNELSRQQASAIIGYTQTLLDRKASLKTGEDGLDAMWSQFGRPVLAKLGGAEDNAPVTDEAVNLGVQALSNAKPSDLKDVVKQLFPAGETFAAPRAGIQSYTDTLRWVAKQGGDPAAALDHIDQQLRALDSASFWAGSNLAVGDMPLEQKIKTLRGRLPFIAGEVEVPPDIRASLADKGYKPVYGQDFLFPQDLVGLNGPLGDLQRSHLRRITLGRFTTGYTGSEINKMKEQAFRLHLATDMPVRGIEPSYAYANTETPWSPASADVEDIVGQLKGTIQEIQHTGGLADERLRNGLFSKVETALQQAHQPHSIFDLKDSHVADLFAGQYGDKGAKIITGALKKARQVGWEFEGMGNALEARLRGNSWLKGTLKVLGKTDVADSMGEWNGFKRAGVGVLAGALALAQGADPRAAAAVGGASAALYGEPTPLRRTAFGVGAAGAAYAATGDPLTAAGAGALGATAGSTSGLINPRFALGAAGAAVIGRTAQAAGMNPGEALATGILGGIGTAFGAKYGARKALDIFSDRGWGEYSKLGEGLAQLRDDVRFSLNPFFDMRRVVKTMIRSGVADLPEGYTLPVNSSLGGAGLGPFHWGGFPLDEQNAMLQRFRGATSPWYNSEAADEMARFATDRGILGFSPTRWMAGAFTHLVNQGMDDAQASELVHKIFTYGGRTGVEKSINAVFFPFSFEKKVLGQMAKFMADDMGRTVVVHDALKAYETLDNRYDLSQKLQDHAPLAAELSKLNMFEFGLSPGEFGGVNRPIIEGLMSSPLGGPVDDTLNLFLPQAIRIDHDTDVANVQKMLQRVVPAYRDIGYLVDDAAQQAHVLFSPSHLTDQAEVSAAYKEWDSFKGQVSTFATQQGATWDQFMRSPKYAPLKQYIEQQRAVIGQKYPAWAAARAAASEKATLLNNELADVTTQPQNEAENELAQFNTVVSGLEQAFSKQTGTSFKTNPDSVPPEYFDAIRNLAVAFARQGNGFEGLYRRYFEPQFGPIQEQVA